MLNFQAVRALAISLPAALLLLGCASTAQRVGEATDQAVANFSACLKQDRAKPEYASLVTHATDLDTRQPTMAQLTDATVPTPTDARLLSARFDDTNACRTNFLDEISNPRPDLVPVFADAFTKRETVVISLVERKITWGDAAKRTQLLGNDMQQRVATANRQWVIDMQAHRAPVGSRQAAAQALMQWSSQRQMFDAVTSR